MDIEPVLFLNLETVWTMEVEKIQIKDTPLTIFEEWVFGKPEVLLDVYHHFGCEWEQTRIQEVMKEHGLTRREMVASHMLEL